MFGCGLHYNTLAAALVTPYPSAHPTPPRWNSSHSETSAIDVCSAVDQMTVAR